MSEIWHEAERQQVSVGGYGSQNDMVMSEKDSGCLREETTETR